MRYIITILIAAALALAGCTTPNVADEQQYQKVKGCSAYSELLRTMSIRKEQGKLSEDQIEAVNEARSIANPLCQGDDSLSGGALDQVDKALDMMIEAKEKEAMDNG